MLLCLYFRGERGDAGRVTQIWDWEVNANCPQILSYTQEIRGKNRSRQWSSRGRQLYKNQSRRGSVPDSADGAYSAPPDPLAGGSGWQPPPPKNPTSSQPLGPRFTICPPPEKSCGRPCRA